MIDRAIQIIAQAPDQFRDGFALWLTENWGLYQRFEREALLAGERRKHWSAHTIVEYLRHDTMLRDADASFKVNEAWSSSLARLFAHVNPQYADLFEFRVREGGVVKEFRPIKQTTENGGIG